MSNRKRDVLRRFKTAGLPRLISDLFNPLFVQPLVIILVAWILGHSSHIIGWLSGIGILLYALIPLGASVYLLNVDQIASLDVPERKSRTRIFLITILCAGIAFSISLIYFSSLNRVIPSIALIFLVNTVIGYLVNRVWKMSMHAAALASAGAIFLYLGQSGPGASLFGMDIFSLCILLLLLPLMIWSRYQLQIHSLPELLGGAASGFVFTFLELIIFTSIW